MAIIYLPLPSTIGINNCRTECLGFFILPGCEAALDRLLTGVDVRDTGVIDFRPFVTTGIGSIVDGNGLAFTGVGLAVTGVGLAGTVVGLAFTGVGLAGRGVFLCGRK